MAEPLDPMSAASENDSGCTLHNVQLLVLQTVCQAQQLKVVNRLFLPRLRNMDRLSRPELVLHLKALGEDSPDAWTKLEIRQRIHELAEEQPSLAAAVAHKTPLETQMSLLNKNSRTPSRRCSARPATRFSRSARCTVPIQWGLGSTPSSASRRPT